MNKARKITGPLGRERMTVKVFADENAMHKFLNSQDNSWQVFDSALTAGTYAQVARVWINVKKLDSSILAHV